ncbi:hypothetical protein [Acinetobacter baumannii]|uniref:hypothetical protein n=1 Tax=Acinetobacter baumannii TaxID=470 RepID=UPI001C0720DF|nr:hypothetical protein [Acinetobacter baumannii]
MGWKGKKPTSFSLDVSKAAEAHVKNIVMDTVQSLVNLSPVDTGAYRASHIVSIGSADFGVREPETNPIQDAAIQAVKIKLDLFKMYEESEVKSHGVEGEKAD